jgi:hypothetical protein
MKRIILVFVLVAVAFAGCSKKPLPKDWLPPHIISFKLVSVNNEFVSLYYIDSVTHNSVTLKITPSLIDNYTDSIPTGSFFSQYLFNACANNGIRNFKLKFYKGGVTELHDLFIDFKWLPPPGGFEIPDAKIDGKALINLPASDSSKYGHGDTSFLYNR